MTAIPECLTRRPTEADACAAADALEARGIARVCGVPLYELRDLASWVGDTQRVLILAAALLDATERAERAEREAAVLRMTGERDREALAALQAHVAAGHVLCTDCDGHGTWSIEADDGGESQCECAACDGTGWRDAVSELAAYRIARAEVKL